MEILRKAENLGEAYVLLDPVRPLEGKWLERFYADRPDEAGIGSLVDELLLDPREDDKTLFTGHRGSGKTTELARLELALQESHTVVRFSVESLLNLGDVDYADLLVVLGLQVYRAAVESGVALDAKSLHDLRFWYATHVFEESEQGKLESAVGGELNAVFAKFSLQLTSDAPFRQGRVRAEAQAHLSDLLERLNGLLQELQDKAGRRTLVIVDGLEKMYDLGQVCNLFCQGADALLGPRCRVIYTVPLAIYNTDDFQQVRLSFPRTFSLPNVKTREMDGAPCPAGRQALLEVLDCRLMPGLFAPKAAERLVDCCGGLLKELIALARQAALRGRRVHGEKGPAGVDDAEYAVRQVRNTFRAGMTEEQYRTLWTYRDGSKRFDNTPVARSLLHNLSLLEYNGGDAWWAVHPIVRPLLDERADELRATGKEASG